MKKFTPIGISSAFFSCAVPLNLDTYRSCPFQCEYCFVKNRSIWNRNESFIPNIKWLRNKFHKIYDKENIIEHNFIEVLLKNRVDLHCGTKSEPFQPREQKNRYTEQIVDICNDYDQHIIFTTKSDTYYDVAVDPDLHSFQLSVTNHVDDKFIEPYVPSIENRVKFFRKLKDEGFKVALRIEPFIPNVTDVEKIVDLFDGVDYVHLSNLMLSPHNDYSEFLNHIGCRRFDFKNKGMLMMDDELCYAYMKPAFEFLQDQGYSWNSRFMFVGNNDCCCGDDLVNNTINFDVLHLKRKYGDEWSMEDGLSEMGEYAGCRCDRVFTSNRLHGCKTIEETYRYKWDKPYTVFHPSKLYKPKDEDLLDYW